MGDGHDLGYHDVDHGSSRAVSPRSEFGRKAFFQVKMQAVAAVSSAGLRGEEGASERFGEG
jgi:hypothetical protein